VKAKVFKGLAYAVSAIGLLASNAASIGCLIIWLDEPEMPASMIEE
jgi:cyclic lactone autoinducer peptide